jgi:hypothetical protein
MSDACGAKAKRQTRKTGSSKRVSDPPAWTMLAVLARISGVRALSFDRYMANIDAAITAWRWPLLSLRASAVERVTRLRILSPAISSVA